MEPTGPCARTTSISSMGSMTMGESYYAEVESYFVARRGSPLFISPGEWHLVSRWEELGIPLEVVKEGIDRVFERPRSRLRPRKLGYCRQTVESAFRRFREARLGLRTSASDDESESRVSSDVSSQLRAMYDRLRTAGEALRSESATSFTQALADASGIVWSALDEVQESVSMARLSDLEDRLTEIDRRLILEAQLILEEPVRTELRREADSSLEAYRERMPEKVYRSARESAYRRRLREKLGLPTLSLYAR